jgi:pimeloyl-ACP methyl ester carboxylesterase
VCPSCSFPPAGSTASTWGAFADELAAIGRVIVYDRRGYARSGGDPPHRVSTHTADAAALLERVGHEPAVVVGTSAGAAIAVDLRMDLATVKVPVVCSYGERSPTGMFRFTRLLAAAIPTGRTRTIEAAGHAAPFEATANFVQLVSETIEREYQSWMSGAA